MKNSKVLRMMILLAAVVICLTACAGNKEPVPQETTDISQNQVESILFERIWKHDAEQNRDVEYGIILGMDSAQEPVWAYVTGKYPVAQDDVVAEVLRTDTQYIFCENGSLISLDILTGDVLWENNAFHGYGVRGMEADNGNLYFCGYLGTSFFAVDKNGKTLHKIDSFGEEYDWAYDIRMDGEKIAVTLDLGPAELRGPEGYVFLVDPADYSFVLR